MSNANRDVNTIATEQTLPISVNVGDRVTLFEYTDVEESGIGFTANVLFEDEIAQLVPDTGLLRFEESDVGRAEFMELLDEAEGCQVIRP